MSRNTMNIEITKAENGWVIAQYSPELNFSRTLFVAETRHKAAKLLANFLLEMEPMPVKEPQK